MLVVVGDSLERLKLGADVAHLTMVRAGHRGDLQMSLALRVYRRIHGRRIRLLPQEIRQRLKGTSVVNDVDVRIHIDAADGRGRFVYEGAGAFDREAVALWKHLVEASQPTVVIDIGANYGEVALSCRYGLGTQVHLVEANPRVARFLAKTVAGRSDVTLHRCAASDRAGSISLYLMGAVSSGLASTKPHVKAESFVEVPSARVDQLVRIERDDQLCFKIDVEGAEISVLKGMSDLLGSSRWSGMLEYAHLSAEELQWLRTHFELRAVVHDPLSLVPFPATDSVWPSEAKRLGIGKDLVIYPRAT